MLPCHDCAYRAEIPGNAHIKCRHVWTAEEIHEKIKDVRPKAIQWFLFPFNYDPCWGPDDCHRHSMEALEENIRKETPLTELASLLGRRLF